MYILQTLHKNILPESGYTELFFWYFSYHDGKSSCFSEQHAQRNMTTMYKKNALKKKYPHFLWKTDWINGFIHVIAEEWRIDLAAPDLCLRRLLFEREKISVSVTSAYWALSCLSDLVQFYCGHDKSSFDKFWDVFFFLALVTRVVREYKHITRAEVHYTKQGQ